MLGQFQQYPIIPKHIWESHTGNKGNDLKTFPNAAPIVGAGPFTLDEFKKDQIALFQRYDGFYGPKPKVDAFGLRMFSNDDALVAALKAHEIDAIEEVPPTAIDTLKKAGFNVSDVPGIDQTDFIINSSPNKKSHPRAAEPEGARGVRQRHRPQADRRRRLPRDREAGGLDHPGRDRRLGQSERAADRVQHRQGELDPRRPRLQERAATGSASRTARRCPTR